MTLALLAPVAAAHPSTVDVTWPQLGLAAGLILVAIGISRWQGLGLGRDLAVGTVRTVVQLVLVGYVLVYVFALGRWYVVLTAMLLMVAVATHTAVGRQKGAPRELWGITGAAMLLGSGLTMAYVGAAIVRPQPWFDPRYMIPLFGMIVGNAMNAAALSAERLRSELESRRGEVEAYLALGAPPARAAREPVRRALRASMIPTINGMMVVGIVSLPGMMTGQILAGASPLLAVRYQIVVMFMLTCSVAITSCAVTLWYRRSFFTPAEQLRPKPDEGNG